ncbi:MAG TPA: squalene/phytoene synthase family protein, partial [Methylocystis sp.]
MDIARTSSGKTHRDENFPVASFLIAPRHRAPILAFYDLVRAADDIADHPTLPAQEKLELLDALDAALMGTAEEDAPVARRLREVCQERRLDPQHARDLIAAFKRDVTQLRYRDWDDLID